MTRLVLALSLTASCVWAQKPTETPQSKVMKRLDADAELIAYRNPAKTREAVAKTVGVLLDLAQSRIDANTRFSDRDRASFGALVSMGRFVATHWGYADVVGKGYSRKNLADDMVLAKSYTLFDMPGNGRTSMAFRLWGSKNHDLTGLKMLPADTVLAWWSDLDLGALYDFHLKMVENSGYDEFKRNYAKVRRQWAEMAMVEELQPPLTEVGVCLAFDSDNMVKIPNNRGGALTLPEPSIAIFVKADFSRLPTRLKPLLQQKRLELKSEVVHTITCYTIPLQEDPPLDVSPSFAMLNGYFVLATNLRTLKEIVGATLGKAGGLRATADFKSLSQGVPTVGTGFTYLTPKLKEILTDLKMERRALPPELAGLRELITEAQKANAGKSFSVSSVDDEGRLTVSRQSPNMLFAKALVPVAVGGVVAGMTLPVLTKAREKARRANCSANLKIFGLALIGYAADHKDRLPDSLAQLKTELPPGETYVCPSTGMSAPKTMQEVARGKTGYLYVGTSAIPMSKIPDPTITVLAADKPENHPDEWCNVLFADGHVEGSHVPDGDVKAWCRRRGYTLMTDLIKKEEK